MRIWALLLVLTTANTFLLTAQDDVIPLRLREVVPNQEQGGFVVVMLDDLRRPGIVTLRYFDQQERMQAETTIPIREEGLPAQYEGVFFWQGHLHLLSSVYNPGPKRNDLILQSYRVSDLQPLGRQILAEAYTPRAYRIPFGYSLSSDRHSLMVYGWSYTLPEDSAKLDVRVFDESLTPRWEQRYVLPFNNQGLYIYDADVKNNGEALLYCEYYTGNPGRSVDERKIQHFMLAGAEGRNSFLKYQFDLPNRILDGLHLQLQPNQELIGAAFYRERRNGKNEGLYTFRIPPDGKSIDKQIYPLTEERFEDAYPDPDGEPAFNPNKPRFRDFFVDHIYEDKSGDLLLLAEQRIEHMTDFDIEFNDILILKTSGAALTAVKRIPKRQTSVQNNWSFFSYKSIRAGDAVYIFYNDDRNNHNPARPSRTLDMYTGGPSAVIASYIDWSGDYRSILINRDQNQQLRMFWPERSYLLPGRRMLFYTERQERNGGVGLFIGIDLVSLSLRN